MPKKRGRPRKSEPSSLTLTHTDEHNRASSLRSSSLRSASLRSASPPSPRSSLPRSASPPSLRSSSPRSASPRSASPASSTQDESLATTLTHEASNISDPFASVVLALAGAVINVVTGAPAQVNMAPFAAMLSDTANAISTITLVISSEPFKKDPASFSRFFFPILNEGVIDSLLRRPCADEGLVASLLANAEPARRTLRCFFSPANVA